jgi:hypothetical protein
MQNLVVVKSFKNREEVMSYLKAINSSDKIYKDLTDPSVTTTVISTPNYNILLEDKSIDRYIKFCIEHYRIYFFYRKKAMKLLPPAMEAMQLN